MPLHTTYSAQLRDYFARVERGQAVEPFEQPFVCESCGGYFHGAELAAQSDALVLHCHSCAPAATSATPINT